MTAACPETPILLTTLNARYTHSAFGLRYLLANLGDLASRARILEFQRADDPQEIAERLLNHTPRIIGIGVHIWNADAAERLVGLLKTVAPEVMIILGGPEVSHEWEGRPIVRLADFVLCGEGDLAFAELCRAILSGSPPSEKIIQAPLPELAELLLPYDLYDDADIAHRVLYVEASRGCPFKCSFCLSALDRTMRPFPLERFLAAMERLLERGARRFKFVDRTFNLHLETAAAILDFFLERYQPGLFLHFELVPDRLPKPLRKKIAAFPAGALQFEIGIQTFQPEVQARIERRQDGPATEENLRWLLDESGVHVHSDLIIGLPGEDMAQFGAGFDRLLALGPQEIQVGVLKRLRGAPINALADEYGMIFNPDPPYDLLQNDRIDFAAMRRLKLFARFWDLTGNAGRFPQTLALVQSGGKPFEDFLVLSDWLFKTAGRTHGIALERLFQLLHRGLTEALQLDPDRAETAIAGDYARAGRGQPQWLKPGPVLERKTAKPTRQARHGLNVERIKS